MQNVEREHSFAIKQAIQGCVVQNYPSDLVGYTSSATSPDKGRQDEAASRTKAVLQNARRLLSRLIPLST